MNYLAAVVLFLGSTPVFSDGFERQTKIPDWRGPFTYEQHIQERPHGYPVCFVTNEDKPGGPGIECFGGRMCSAIRHMSWGVNGPINVDASYADYLGDGVLEMACYVQPFPDHICAPTNLAQNNPQVNQHKYIRRIFAYRNSFVLRYNDGSRAATFYFERTAESVGDDDVAVKGTRQYVFWRPGARNILEGFGHGWNNHPICHGYNGPPLYAPFSEQKENK